MSKGKIGAQCAHAAVGCYKRGLIETPKLIKSWENCGQPKVVLRVDSEQSLFELKREADSFGIVTSLICDSGRSQVTPGTYTVLGIGPDLETRVNKVTGELKLF